MRNILPFFSFFTTRTAASKKSRKGFTLIELLVVIAIVAVLAVVVVLVLNPAQLLAQARDSNRLSDLATIKSAVSYYMVDTFKSTIGSSSISYTSVSDPAATSSAGTTCSTNGMIPATGWLYHCPLATSSRYVDGTGWLPVALNTISVGSPVSQLPLDPINASGSYFYNYMANGGNFALTGLLESAKYLKPIGSNGSNYDLARYTIGTSLPLVGQAEGLVRNWPFEEGTGTVSAEIGGISSPADNGTFSGQTAVNDWSPLSAKIGYGAAQLTNGSQLTYTTSSSLPTAVVTVAVWAAVTTSTGHAIYNYLAESTSSDGGYYLWSDASGNVNFSVYHPALTANTASGCSAAFTTGTWHFVVGTYDGTTVRVFLDGTQCATSVSLANQTLYSGAAMVSSNSAGSGKIIWYDDIRVLSRPMSATEISQYYRATN